MCAGRGPCEGRSPVRRLPLRIAALMLSSGESGIGDQRRLAGASNGPPALSQMPAATFAVCVARLARFDDHTLVDQLLNLGLRDAEFAENLARLLAEQRSGTGDLRLALGELDRQPQRTHAAHDRVYGLHDHVARMGLR